MVIYLVLAFIRNYCIQYPLNSDSSFFSFRVFAHACENCKVGLLEDDCINSRPFRENGTIGKIIIDMEGSLIFQERHFLS